MEVLEFGCGTGGTAIIHAPYVKHIRAIDISGNMIAIAKGKAEADSTTCMGDAYSWFKLIAPIAPGFGLLSFSQGIYRTTFN